MHIFRNFKRIKTPCNGESTKCCITDLVVTELCHTNW